MQIISCYRGDNRPQSSWPQRKPPLGATKSLLALTLHLCPNLRQRPLWLCGEISLQRRLVRENQTQAQRNRSRESSWQEKTPQNGDQTMVLWSSACSMVKTVKLRHPWSFPGMPAKHPSALEKHQFGPFGTFPLCCRILPPHQSLYQTSLLRLWRCTVTLFSVFMSNFCSRK